MNWAESLVASTESVALYVLDIEGRILSWNPGARLLHGFASDEVLGKPFSLVCPDSDTLLAEIGSDAANGKLRIERMLLKNNGAQFTADLELTVLREDTGAVAGYAVAAQDVSKTKKLENLLQRTTDELQRFAFVVSHDLQEPTRTIRSYSELLQRRYDDRLEGDAKEFLGFMTDAALRMTHLLRDLLAYSQAGRIDRTKPELTDSSTIIQWALMNVNTMAKSAGASITYDSLPKVEVDQGQFANLLEHLFTNSLKFRSAATPNIHVAAEPQERMWRFAVADNGIGIDPQYHERVFEVFKRLHGKEIPGTGIGLSICRKIVEAHGGKMWLDSALNSGTTVFFTLPAGES